MNANFKWDMTHCIMLLVFSVVAIAIGHVGGYIIGFDKIIDKTVFWIVDVIGVVSTIGLGGYVISQVKSAGQEDWQIHGTWIGALIVVIWVLSFCSGAADRIGTYISH